LPLTKKTLSTQKKEERKRREIISFAKRKEKIKMKEKRRDIMKFTRTHLQI
jgi:hypothetical protein